MLLTSEVQDIYSFKVIHSMQLYFMFHKALTKLHVTAVVLVTIWLYIFMDPINAMQLAYSNDSSHHKAWLSNKNNVHIEHTIILS